MTKTKVEWTLPSDVLDKARLVWRRGVPLSAEAAGTGFSPVRVSVRGPAAGERGARFEDLRAWLDSWRSAPAMISVDWKPVRDRVLGRVELPVAAQLVTVDDVAKAAGPDAVRALAVFRQNLAATPDRFRGYLQRRPLRVVEIGGDWSAVLSAAMWLEENPNSGLHARQIPAQGVHTKIVETYRRDIAELVPRPGEAPATSGKGWFAARYGLAVKPPRVRMRFLDPTLAPGPWSDVEIPIEEADANAVSVERVLIVENEVSFLSLPELRGTVAVFGDGRRAGSLMTRIGWLASAPIWYWGDVDTWGLVILDGLRAAVAGRAEVSSLLMDEGTLLANRAVWVVEDVPEKRQVGWLTEDEAALYDALVSGRWGDRVRLEQERIAWESVAGALEEAGFVAVG